MPTQICDVAEVISYLGKSTTASETEVALINQVKPSAESRVRQWIGSSITQATYTHFLPIANAHLGSTYVLRLPEFPARSITNIWVDLGAMAGQATGDTFTSDALLTAGDDYALDMNESGLAWFGHVLRKGTKWSTDPGSIKVTYVAGWSDDELAGNVSDMRLDASAIKMGTLIEIADDFFEALSQQTSGGTGEIAAESLEGYQVTYDVSRPASRNTSDISDRAKKYLWRFRRLTI